MRCRIVMLAVVVVAAGSATWDAAAAPTSKPQAEPSSVGRSKASHKVGRPFAYSGYSKPEYKGVKVSSHYVPVSDGAKLAVDVYLPSDGPACDAFPVILEYTPYQRATIDPATGKIDDAMDSPEYKLYVSHGYAFVRADMRGTGASTRWMLDFMPRLGDDGKELVDWIAAQPWCDGNVGMQGESYLGWSQTATAARRPEALKCIMPTVIPLDGYTGEAFPGGIYLEGFVKDFSSWMFTLTRNYCLPDKGMRPAKPVVDEDGDGDLADEIPVDLNKNGTFLDDGFPPTYSDGQPRQHLYFYATYEHQNNYDYHGWASKPGNNFIDAAIPMGLTLYDLSPSAHVPGIMESHIPVYDIGGWFDAFTRGTFELYCTMAKANVSKLLICPAYHELTGGPFWKYFGEDPAKVAPRYFAEHLRFFDRYLKGIDNGIDREPPICIYAMNGGGWRFENEWPLARQVTTKYYFDADHALTSERKAEGADTYKADLTHSSTYTGSQGNRWLGIGNQVPNEPPHRTDKDAQCLVYTSAPLPKNTEVTGHPILHIQVSSTAEDGDFFVYLEDVDKDGESLLVTEGQLRAGFAALRNNDKMIAGGKFHIDVKPELPWHGFERADYNDRIFADGNVVELVIDYIPTSWVFRKGHRVRVSIACADYPTFPLHPKLSPKNDPKDPGNVVPTITVYRDATHASYLELPVIPPRATGILPMIPATTAR